MTTATRRAILRWIHLAFALPLIGFVYGPPAEVEPYRPNFQYIFVPVVILTGLWLWKGHVVRRWLSIPSADARTAT